MSRPRRKWRCLIPTEKAWRQQVSEVLVRSVSSQYQPSLTRQMAEPFVFLFSSIFWLEPARAGGMFSVLKTVNTIRKNLSWKLTHSNCPVINTFSASQNWREHNFVQTLTCFFLYIMDNFPYFCVNIRKDYQLPGSVAHLENYYFSAAGGRSLQCHKWDDLITSFPGPETISRYLTVLIVQIPSEELNIVFTAGRTLWWSDRKMIVSVVQ